MLLPSRAKYSDSIVCCKGYILQSIQVSYWQSYWETLFSWSNCCQAVWQPLTQSCRLVRLECSFLALDSVSVTISHSKIMWERWGCKRVGLPIDAYFYWVRIGVGVLVTHFTAFHCSGSTSSRHHSFHVYMLSVRWAGRPWKYRVWYKCRQRKGDKRT